ncbi:MAG: DUF21 domain-containing protein [Candidatus Marinimicrobia bacterium]|nr:DUF21 domain-containing protein [Candidatus Neomarinimicrobiota bacterium]
MSPFLFLFRFVLLLFFSGFFSGTETALFAFPRERRKKMLESEHAWERKAGNLLQKPRKLLITILTANTIVNIAVAITAVIFTEQYVGEWNVGLAIAFEIIAVTIVLLIFGEIGPKLSAVRNPVRFVSIAIYPFQVFYFLLYPLVFLLEKFTTLFTEITGIEKEVLFDSEEEVEQLVKMGEKSGAIEQIERQMIEAIFDFGEKTAANVMIPVEKIQALPSHSTMEDMHSLICKQPHRCYPVYRTSRKRIQGYVYTKHYVDYFEWDKMNDPIQQIIQPAYYVPQDRSLDDLLGDLQRKRLKMAIVIDENGEAVGLVTTEDIIEEIVGEIEE